MNTPTILEDDREIQAIWTSEQCGWDIVHTGVSRDDCTKIVAYGEPGEHAWIPWFAVYNGDVLVVRVPAHKCEAVRYQ